jgi:hypothetical protein
MGRDREGIHVRVRPGWCGVNPAGLSDGLVAGSAALFVALVVIDGDDRDYVLGPFDCRPAAHDAGDELAASHTSLHAVGTAELVNVALAGQIAAAYDAMRALDGAA